MKDRVELLESIIEDIKDWEIIEYTTEGGVKESYLQVECEEQLLEMELDDLENIDTLTKELLANIIIDKYMD